jgi:hypothetical protein
MASLRGAEPPFYPDKSKLLIDRDGDKLSANYPDGKHDFPEDVRKVAYEWLDKWIK